ncbi:MAG: phage terminase large subunit [Eubacteriales bacterium]
MGKLRVGGQLILRGSPSPRQEEFFSAHTGFVAYGGARGGGKSWAVRRKLVLMCLKYPGLRALLVRRSFPELRENHIRPLCAELKEGAVWSEGQKCFTFPNGSILKLGYCDNEGDVLRYQGQEYDVIALDEATQLTEFQFATFKACIRGANEYPKRMYLTCNPGGVGHGWVKRLFIDREYREGEDGEDYAFIPASVFDNKALLDKNPGYVNQLKSLPGELRSAWLYGRWDVFAGQFFPEFDYDVHTCAHREPRSGSRRVCAIDYGLDMLAAVYVELSEDGRCYVYDEVHESGLIVSEAANRLKEKAQGVSLFIAPSDLWSRQKDSGRSIAALFSSGGIHLTKLSSGREEGWLALKELMRVGEGVSPILVISRRCVNLIRCVPLLMYDADRPGDASGKPHSITHITDALRYFAASGQPTPSRPPAKAAGKLIERLRRS